MEYNRRASLGPVKLPEPEKTVSVPDRGIPFQHIVLFSICMAPSFAGVRLGWINLGDW